MPDITHTEKICNRTSREREIEIRIFVHKDRPKIFGILFRNGRKLLWSKRKFFKKVKHRDEERYLRLVH